jgi:TRAP-type C4-dicarboxylate transport system permease small subunit
MIDILAAGLRRVNAAVALVAGSVLLVTAGFVIADIVLRQLGHTLGGSDEISGYVMAGLASWGLSYALSELAHVRIDLIRQRLQSRGRAVMDVFAMLVSSGAVLVIAFQAWPVLEKSLARGSRANTPLETPLWIPQVVWFSGWVWFAVTCCVLSLLALAALAGRDYGRVDALIGARGEAEDAQ